MKTSNLRTFRATVRSTRRALVASVAALVVALTQVAVAQTVNHVYSFTSQNLSESPLMVTLIQGRDGKLYATAAGSSGAPNGTVFRITTADVLTELFAFDFTNGCCPNFGLALASDGNFYGTASGGGSTNNGVLFKIAPTGTYSVLHDFSGGSDGKLPSSPPIQASDGNFYGTTIGSSAVGSTLYRYSAASTVTTIYNFGGFVDPYVIQGSDGNLYGVSSGGGTKDCGAVFEMTTAGVLLQSFSFPCGAGGNGPHGLMQATDGNFYGTTGAGGTANMGTVFKMTPDFQVSILYSFGSQIQHDGRRPAAGLMQATDGNLYGTTTQGGTVDMGTLFQISTSGSYKQLYSFLGKKGKFPSGALMQHTKGLLWGTAEQGGANGLGTVFALDMGLGPFITFVQPTGKVGQTAQILGQGFKGTTSVTFNGVPATSFVVGTDTYLRAVIPSGATTGPVVVSTSKGTLASNVNFVVAQ